MARKKSKALEEAALHISEIQEKLKDIPEVVLEKFAAITHPEHTLSLGTTKRKGKFVYMLLLQVEPDKYIPLAEISPEKKMLDFSRPNTENMN